MTKVKLPVYLLQVGDKFTYSDGRKWLIEEIVKPVPVLGHIGENPANYEIKARNGGKSRVFYLAGCLVVDAIRKTV